MVSFDSFDEMYKFAREVDDGIKCLEDKLKNPERLRYGDKKANDKANLCLDTIEEDILNIQAEVKELIDRETEELHLLIEERNEFASYVKDIETGTNDFKNILAPYGYEHRHHEDSMSVNNVPLPSSLPPDSSLLENMSGSLVAADVLDDTGDGRTYTVQHSDFSSSDYKNLANYLTPELFERPVQSNRSEISMFSCTVQNYNAECPNERKIKLEKDISTPKPNNSLLMQTYIYTPSDSGFSNLSHVMPSASCNDKRKLKNDILTPKADKSLYMSTQVTTPTDPGFSNISRQVYKLNMGRYKQKNKENEILDY